MFLMLSYATQALVVLEVWQLVSSHTEAALLLEGRMMHVRVKDDGQEAS